MDFIDQIKSLGAQVSKQREFIKTEESTKNALILPFISTLGYNVFDATEVIPEYDANFGQKLGYKCDYAVFRDGKPIMLFECKWGGRELEKKDEDQLRQYFAACPDAKIAVVTNGLLYRFFMDLEKENVMDKKPFLEFDVLNIKPNLTDALKRFTKSSFDIEEIMGAARNLKYTGEILRIVGEEFASPSEDFVRFFAGRVHDGKLTAKIVQKFTEITGAALKQYINDRISETVRGVLEKTEAPNSGDSLPPFPVEPVIEEPTSEETDAYHIIRALLYTAVSPARIFPRNFKSHCGILLDDSKKKPICRLYLDGEQKYVGFCDEPKKENKESITTLNDLYPHAERLKRIVENYERGPQASNETAIPNDAMIQGETGRSTA